MFTTFIILLAIKELINNILTLFLILFYKIYKNFWPARGDFNGLAVKSQGGWLENIVLIEDIMRVLIEEVALMSLKNFNLKFFKPKNYCLYPKSAY